ncbi:nitrilase-related carbon-nitrogen hydrolase [Streptomyces sp. NPDC058316]|uniref:nitrilase-related carbon-nitrogen hydrolase n=1 Tax=unclassified Streptomyces TaxID=2593676 RepID=UPI003328A94D
MAVAQSTVPEDPTDSENLRASGDEIRRLMRDASAADARLVQFPEGAINYPSKHVMSSGPPGILTAGDWNRVDWNVMRAQPQAVADLAGELGLWVVFGSIHPLTPPHRPHNSVYVVSDEGALAARYDKHYLSNTELSYLYTPGTAPLVFEVDGIRFGTALCIEANFPELFEQYEQMDVDCVLISVMVDDAARAALVPAYAASTTTGTGTPFPPSSVRPRPPRSPRPVAAALPAAVPTAGPTWRSPTSTETHRTPTSTSPSAMPAPGAASHGRTCTPAASLPETPEATRTPPSDTRNQP